MSSSGVDCPGIPRSTFISGHAVRISLYVQTLATIVLTHLQTRDSEPHWTLIMSTVSLCLTGLIYGAQARIALLDGIIISQSRFFPPSSANSHLTFVMASSPPNIRRLRICHLHLPQPAEARQQRAVASVGDLTLAMRCRFVCHVPHWVGQVTELRICASACNAATKFALLGARLEALGAGRTLNLVVFSTLTLVVSTGAVASRKHIWAMLRRVFYGIFCCGRRRPEEGGRGGYAAPAGSPSSGKMFVLVLVLVWSCVIIVQTELQLWRNELQEEINTQLSLGEVSALDHRDGSL
ncbi:hypothetical protein NLJ89_g5565 [Agrocybe chaxingu]|uniref:Uncharacterized protein n=1 Tax=Agrocybe chaxingu TaxID=84603 RepID=A0A9W8MUW2_9AGAR|nr:hypothetical protein NLJ89_g5565 [Agrocybe chaxingu]